MKELHQLTEFLAALTLDDLPGEVIERALLVVRDTVGVILGGMREPEVRALAAYASQNHPGPVSLFGHPGTTTAAWASLVHGTAGTSLEMDEGHAFARGHAAIHALPPALALAQQHRSGGAQALTAFVVGYEAAARAGVATRLRKPVHPFGAWGVLGAAAASAWFLGRDAAGMAGTLEMAASYAISASFETAYQGANVRNTFAGLVNRLGLLAADLHLLGFEGESGGLQTSFGEILGSSFDPQALVDGLGERFEIMRGYFKPHSACRYTHAAVDAVLALREEAPVEASQVASIEVETYDIAARLTDPRPRTPLAGRFSLPYVTAATLVSGSAGPEIFEPTMLADPGILALASQVTVREAEDFTAMTPARRPARVVLHLKNGARREKTVTSSKGDPDQPMTTTELQAKFHRLADPSLTPPRATKVWEILGRLPQVSDLEKVVLWMAPAE